MESGSEDNQWKSELMLKDPRWSVSEGEKSGLKSGHIKSFKHNPSIMGVLYFNIKDHQPSVLYFI